MGFLLDTFTCERKHVLLEFAAEPIRNTSCFERTCLCRALTLHIASLCDGIHDGLINAEADATTASVLGLVACSMSKDIRVDGTLMNIGDILLINSTQAVELVVPISAQFGVGQPARLGFLVDPLHFVDEVSLDLLYEST